MKILLLTHIYPPAIDGGSKVIFKLGQYFQSHGHTIKAISSNCYSTDDFTHRTSHHTPEGLPVITIFHKPFKLLSKIFPALKPFSKGPLFSPLPFIKVLISVFKFKPDLIVAGPLPTTIVLYAQFIKFVLTEICKLKTEILINASFHPTDPDFHSSLLIKALKSADYLWTLTDYETKYFHSKFNIPYSKMINVGNGIDQSYLTSFPHSSRGDKGGFNLIFVGSLSAHKGIDTLLKLHHKIVICGQKTLYSSQFKSKPNVIFKYNQSDSQIKKLIFKSSILILPSSQESFGLVLLEAWAQGIPVITSDIPQLKELIKKSGGGLTFKLGDSADLNNKINQILNSKILNSKLSKMGYRYAQAHTWDKIGDRICQKIGY